MSGNRWPSVPRLWRLARTLPGTVIRPLARASPLCVVNKLNGCKGCGPCKVRQLLSARMTRKVYHESGQNARRSGCRQGQPRHLLSRRNKGTHQKHKALPNKTHQEGKGHRSHRQFRGNGAVRGTPRRRMPRFWRPCRKAGRMEDEEICGVAGDDREDRCHRLRGDPRLCGFPQAGAAKVRQANDRRLQKAQTRLERQEKPDQGQDAGRQSTREHPGQGHKGLCGKASGRTGSPDREDGHLVRRSDKVGRKDELAGRPV